MKMSFQNRPKGKDQLEVLNALNQLIKLSEDMDAMTLDPKERDSELKVVGYLEEAKAELIDHMAKYAVTAERAGYVLDEDFERWLRS